MQPDLFLLKNKIALVTGASRASARLSPKRWPSMRPGNPAAGKWMI